MNQRDDTQHVSAPCTGIPWLLRLPKTPGIVLSVISAGVSIYLRWQTHGMGALHGVWIAALVVLAYYWLQDYFRLRLTIQELRASAVTREILHYQSGSSPHDSDYNFASDKETKEHVTPQGCTVTITQGMIKIVRPNPKGRYYCTIRHYTHGPCVRIRNTITRRFRVAFQYKTSGPPFRMSVRLRVAGVGWQKRPDGKYCVETLVLGETDWADAPPVVLEPADPSREFEFTLELENGPSEPGPEHYLVLRNVCITEDA